MQGSLFQRCSSTAEAEARLVQALSLGSIIATIPPESLLAVDTAQWFRAVMKSTIPPFHTPSEDLPKLLSSVPPITDEGDNPILDLPAGMQRLWQRYYPGRKPVLAYASSSAHSQAIREDHTSIAVGLVVADDGESSAVSSCTPSPHPRPTHVPALSAVGGARFAGEGLAAGVLREARPVQPPAGDGFYVVFCGRTPWLYYEE